MKKSFGLSSTEKLKTCHKDLQLVLILALAECDIDFGIAQGARTYEQQLDYFNQGKSKLDPRVSANLANAKHVVGGGAPRDCSYAADIYAYHPDAEIRKKIAYDVGSLCYIAGVIQTTAKRLFKAGQITYLVRWGGNWDEDGVILHDQSFDDLPHFEIYKP